jgi:hypothetical protein
VLSPSRSKGQVIQAMDNLRFGSNNSNSKKPAHLQVSLVEAKEKARSLMVKGWSYWAQFWSATNSQ